MDDTDNIQTVPVDIYLGLVKKNDDLEARVAELNTGLRAAARLTAEFCQKMLQYEACIEELKVSLGALIPHAEAWSRAMYPDGEGYGGHLLDAVHADIEQARRLINRDFGVARDPGFVFENPAVWDDDLGTNEKEEDEP